MILPAQAIRKIRPVEPFCERSEFGGLTYGLGPAGYDVRIAQGFVIPANGFHLASTIERFTMPADVLAYVKDKSTWARRGVVLQSTVIEPGWNGFLTLEITNHSDEPVQIEPGMPIAQIVFHRLECATEAPYDGRYQNQEAGPQKARFASPSSSDFGSNLAAQKKAIHTATDDLIAFLNSIVSIDPYAIAEMMSVLVPCNEMLARHPSIQVLSEGVIFIAPGTWRVGLLGLLNGFCGVIDSGINKGSCPITAFYEEGRLIGFWRKE
jgi:dCTP deaminase